MREWVYEAVVTKIYDADTITVDLDMGMYVWQKNISVRLYGLNAPEMGTPEGKTARDALRVKLPIGSIIRVESHAFEKYGRLLAKIYLKPDDIEINAWLLDNHYAQPYMVGAEAPVSLGAVELDP